MLIAEALTVPMLMHQKRILPINVLLVVLEVNILENLKLKKTLRVYELKAKKIKPKPVREKKRKLLL